MLKDIHLKRRQLIKGLGLSALGAASLSACSNGDTPAASKPETIEWSMVTAWPKNFPGLGSGANNLAELIEKLSAGKLQIRIYGANELVGSLEVFDAVSSGKVQMGHSAAYYWHERIPAASFFAAVPFGLTAQEMNAWLYQDEGLALWEETYRPYNLIPAAVGNTGVQMGGWFNREIQSIDDLKGLRMRIPGLGGEVIRRAGGIPVLLSGGEIFPALQAGSIDATEWVGPYNDLAFGLHKIARYYYYPGWHEPGTTMEALINRDAFEALPEELQFVVKTACRVANQDMLADFTSRNNIALQRLQRDHQVELRRFPDRVLAKLQQLSEEVVAEFAATDPQAMKVFQSFQRFKQQAGEWHALSEAAYLRARSL